MARARNIKPAFFLNESLAAMPAATRLLFIGLWTLADREGRLEDRPLRIKAAIFPYEDVDVDPMLAQLTDNGFIDRYEVGKTMVIEILNFVKHQDPHYKERASELPARPGRKNKIVAVGVTRTQRRRILLRDGNRCVQCNGTESLCIDHVIPTSRGGDSSDGNLQTLCSTCNTKKGNKLEGESLNRTRPELVSTLPEPPRELDSTSTRRWGKDESIMSGVRSNKSAPVPLIPSSLIPSSLIPDSLNTPAFVGAWESWKTFRNEKDKKPLTLSTAKAQLNKLAKMGTASAIASIEQSIERGWTGLFAPKDDQHGTSRQPSRSAPAIPEGIDRDGPSSGPLVPFAENWTAPVPDGSA